MSKVANISTCIKHGLNHVIEKNTGKKGQIKEATNIEIKISQAAMLNSLVKNSN